MMNFILWATGQINDPQYVSRRTAFDDLVDGVFGWLFRLGVFTAFIAFCTLIMVLTLRALGVVG